MDLIVNVAQSLGGLSTAVICSVWACGAMVCIKADILKCSFVIY
jgi:hypothetical protein